jgi:PKD repeat protein
VTASVLAVTSRAGTVVSDLTTAATPATTIAGLLIFGPSAGATSGPLATRVASTPPASPASTLRGAQMGNGAALTNSTLDAGDGGYAGIATQDNVTLADDVARGPDGLYMGPAPGMTTAQRLTLDASKYAIEAHGTPIGTTIDGVLATIDATATGAGIRADDGAKLTLNSATLVSTTGHGHNVSLIGTGATTDTTVTVQDSILRGFGDGLDCSAATGGVTFVYDNVHLAAGEHCTLGSIGTSGVTDQNPKFVDSAHGDYRLRFDSPDIDVGEGTCSAFCPVSDLDGLTRPIHGVRDLGAYEYGRRAPVVSASADRATAAPGDLISYTATGSDADHGDTLTYAWSFDDGASATGASPTHAFASEGTHTATVTVTDPIGLTGSAAVSVAVAVPAAGEQPPAQTPTTPIVMPAAAAPPLVIPPVVIKDTTAPKLSKVSFSPSTFKVSSKSTATSAKATPKGSTLKFTLGEAAKVVVTIIKPKGGVKSGKSCKAPSKKHPVKHPQKCDLTLGTITRKNQAATADKLAFSGRIGRTALAKGKYKASLSATDTAGNRSKASTATFTIV